MWDMDIMKGSPMPPFLYIWGPLICNTGDRSPETQDLSGVAENGRKTVLFYMDNINSSSR